MLRLQNAQITMDYVDKLYPDCKSNDRSAAVKINGPVNEDALRLAFSLLIERHEALRSCKNPTIPGALSIQDSMNVPVQILDARHIRPIPAVQEIPKTLQDLNQMNFLEERFPLYTGPLWRVALIKFADNQYHLVFLFNHIIVDELSIGIILKDLSAYYNAIVKEGEFVAPEYYHAIVSEGESAALKRIPPLTQVEQSIRMNDDTKSERLKYWKEQLKDLNQAHLQPDTKPKKKFPFPGKRISFKLDAELIKIIKEKTAITDEKGKREYSNNVVNLTCFFILMHLMTQETDLCAGITSANRLYKEIDKETMGQLVNAFFNSIPIRVRLKEGVTVAQLLKEVKEAQGNALKNQLPHDLIYEKAVDRSTKSALSFASPFSMLFVLNEPKPAPSFTGTTAEPPEELDLAQCKMPDFGINIDELDDKSLRFTIEYNTDRYNEKTMQSLYERFLKVLTAMAEDPQKVISDIPVLLPDDEKRIQLDKVLAAMAKERQNTAPKRPVYIHEYLHMLAHESPNRTALTFHHDDGSIESISYEELDLYSTQLANYLKQQGIVPGMPIGLRMPRSIKLYIALFALLKVGGVFVPLDQDDRMAAFKVADAKIQTILCDQDSGGKFLGKNTINIHDQQTWQTVCKADTEYVPFEHKPSDTAYTIHTSGTTGTPKGIQCSHDGLSNLLEDLIQQHLQSPVETPLKILSTAPPTFDAFIYDILKMLAEGGELHLSSDKNRLSPKAIETICRRFNIDFAVVLPSLMKELDPTLPLKHIISMGEPPQPEVIDRWLAHPVRGKPRVIENGYGPSEAGICVSTQKLGSAASCNLIGTSINNMQMLLLDPQTHALCPMGVPGEIFISGPGLAKGYLNEDHNNQRFIWMRWQDAKKAFIPCDPKDPNAVRFLATGDYGIYRPYEDEARIEFLGRKDRQVKINGAERVDLNAIENSLRSLPFIKDIVLVPNKETSALTAYLETNDMNMSNLDMRKEIRKHLSTSTSTLLPGAAYPKAVIGLPELPRTTNGKIDYKSLPTVPLSASPTKILNSDPLKNKLIRMWARLLDCPDDQIDTCSTFWELGGNSIDRLRLEIRLNYEFRPKEDEYIGPDILTDSLTIDQLAKYMSENLTNITTVIPPDYYVLGDTLFVPSTLTGAQSSSQPQKIGQNEYDQSRLQ